MKNDEQKQVHKDIFEKRMDRRDFIQQTTKIAGVTFGLSLINPLGSVPVRAESVVAKSRVSVSLSNKKPSFQFGLVADAQYADIDSKGTRFYRASLDKLTEAVKTFNEHDLKFTVQLGDLIDRNESSFSKILPIYNKVNGPKYHVLGNHDYAMDAKSVANLLGMQNFYYDFGYDGWRFIVIDTNDLSTYANPIDSEKYRQSQNIYEVLKWSGAENAQTWNGGVGSDQMTWLRDVLKKSAQAGEKVVVIGHAPISPLNVHNAWNDEALVKELESAGNVAAYFNGHNHAGNYAEKNGIHYVNFKGMVETADTNAFSIVRVYHDRLEIKGFDREENRVLKIKQKRKTAIAKMVYHA
ncbi:metallophosphoesterase [Metabacillus arenae]|uniref:Metallophosphoesterase n=1 Tax=Metabacillus arenae TaxID=2771434 RepID=A0A926NS69_9BACI|nr:metallophosphoesterase [Metabacillus arenae]MBD1382977.1 metallophosphoesterase [Metabacillus arenae]